jgi:PAS domain S-box-containing protein
VSIATDVTVIASTHELWTLFAVVSAVLNGALGAYLWRRRSMVGALPLAVAMLIVAAWFLAYAAQLAAADATMKQAFFLVGDFLTLPAVLAGLWFALEYAGLERWLTRPVVAALALPIIVILPLYLVDGARLLWTDLPHDGTVGGGLAPLGLAFALYGLVVALVSTAVLLLLFVRSPAHRVPVVLILVGHVALRATYLLESLGIDPLPGVPGAAIAINLNSLMYAIALFRLRLFDLLPVARETIFQRMPDALLVIDADDRMVSLNAAAEDLLGLSSAAGRHDRVAQALARFPQLAASVATPASDATAESSAEVSIEARGGSRTCQVSTTQLADWQGRTIGRLVTLHDITALRRVEDQLIERERALAAAQERERLARELHDGLAQDLWLAKLKATRLVGQPGLGSEARALGDEITAAVDAGIAEARQAVATLRGSDATNGSLRELLSRSLEDFEDRFGLAVEWECPDELPELPPRAEVEVLRIVGEALANVRRHADATVVRVRGGVDDGLLVLEVRDNGRGFDPTALDPGTYGVAGMCERAAQIGGKLEIESAPRHGTRVRLHVPVAAATVVEAGLG